MIYFILSFLIIYLLLNVSLRYLPVKNVPFINLTEVKQDTCIVDVRDYNNITEELSERHIPVAYLRRYYNEISAKKVVLIISNSLEKNMGTRYLRKKGFDIVGYYHPDCTDSNENFLVKGGCHDGI